MGIAYCTSGKNACEDCRRSCKPQLLVSGLRGHGEPSVDTNPRVVAFDNSGTAVCSGSLGGPVMSKSTSKNLTSQQQSRWDEGIAVVRSLLNPRSMACQAMTDEQRHGLGKVEELLLEGLSCLGASQKENVMNHIPTELIRMESESSTTNTSYKYIMKEFGGVQEKTALSKVRTALIAHAWARKALSKSVRRMAGQNTTSRIGGGRSLDDAEIPGRNEW